MVAIAYNLAKFNFIAFFSLLLTFGLFYFMQYLIQTDGNIGPKLAIVKIIDATVPVFEIDLIEDIAPPKEIDVPPIKIPVGPRTDVLPAGPIVPVSYATDLQPFNPDIASFGITDSEMIPLVRVPPNYPNRALTRGIEGYVELSFTVNSQGNVENPVVTHAKPESIFDKAAIAAIQRWKYSPKLQDGRAIATHNVRQRLLFKMNPVSQ